MKPLSKETFSEPVDVELAGAGVRLYPERGLYWPEQKTLFVADVHLGKAGTFRHFGLPVPETAAQDLQTLSLLLERTDADRLIVLGDFTHHNTGVDALLVESVARWREQCPKLSVGLVAGNHDRHMARLPAEWRIESLPKELTLGPFELRHEPPAADVEATADRNRFWLAGHLHPCFALVEAGRQRLKCPGFWMRRNGMVLPAFSQFTDGAIVSPRATDRAFAVLAGQVAEIPLVS